MIEAVREADASGTPLLVIGGGSNLVIGDKGFDGTALRIATEGFALNGTTLELAAGEIWTDVVARTVEAGLAGIECLAGIPGSAGATPIQNVGAYGQEVSSTITEVVAYDRHAGETVTIPNADCAFSYRHSRFKAEPDRFVVLRVRFELEDAGGLSAPLRYAETARAMGVEQGERVPAAAARATVLGLRAGKGMVLDPEDHDSWSAGSFFTNPILEEAEYAAFLARAEDRLGPGTTPPPSPRTGTRQDLGGLAHRQGRFHQGVRHRPGPHLHQAHPRPHQPGRGDHRGPPRPRPRGRRRGPRGVRRHARQRTGDGRREPLGQYRPAQYATPTPCLTDAGSSTSASIACATSARERVRPLRGVPPTAVRYVPVNGPSVSFGGRTDVQSAALRASAASIRVRSA